MNRQALTYFKRFCTVDATCNYIDSLLVTTFVLLNKLQIKRNLLIKDHILPEDEKNVKTFISYLTSRNMSISLEDLMEMFEFVISPKDKEVNGSVYTPDYIRAYILNTIFSGLNPNQQVVELTYADLSCGCGGFLLDIAKHLHKQQGKAYAQIFRENIFGVDIQPYSIERTKIMFSLLALTEGEDVEDFEYNLFVGNSLNFDWQDIPVIAQNHGFDIIVGNPPYVSSSKIDEESKALLPNWQVTHSGKADLYIPFFQIALEALRENGLLGYITVNNFYRSTNGRCLRRYFVENKWKLGIVDFGAEKVFKGRTVYTCLFFARKEQNGTVIYCQATPRTIAKGENPLEDAIEVPYEKLAGQDVWILGSDERLNFIQTIERTGDPLGKLYDIKNGIATLRNDVYIIDVERQDGQYYYFKKNNIEHHVEVAVCREIVKGNILRKQGDIEIASQQVISPYRRNGNRVELIPEQEMQQQFPLAYMYLQENAHLLKERDKGKRIYEAWYAFGRTQALAITGNKLLFPYIADAPYFVLSENQNLLFYNGYAIISHNIEDLQILQKILSTKLFWSYIRQTSKPYSGNFFSLSKNYIKKFGIPHLTSLQKERILQLEGVQLEQYLTKFYDFGLAYSSKF